MTLDGAGAATQASGVGLRSLTVRIIRNLVLQREDYRLILRRGPSDAIDHHCSKGQLHELQSQSGLLFKGSG